MIKLCTFLSVPWEFDVNLVMVTNFLMFQFLIAVQNIMIVIYLVLNSLDGLIEGKESTSMNSGVGPGTWVRLAQVHKLAKDSVPDCKIVFIDEGMALGKPQILAAFLRKWTLPQRGNENVTTWDRTGDLYI